MVSQFF
jgi:hypothetical protein